MCAADAKRRPAPSSCSIDMTAQATFSVSPLLSIARAGSRRSAAHPVRPVTLGLLPTFMLARDKRSDDVFAETTADPRSVSDSGRTTVAFKTPTAAGPTKLSKRNQKCDALERRWHGHCYREAVTN